MGSTKKRKGVKKRRTSATPPQIRVRYMTDIIYESLEKKLEEPGVDDLMFMLIHRMPPAVPIVKVIASPHFSTETVEEVFTEALRSYSRWGSMGDFEGDGLTQNAVEVFVREFHKLALSDPAFAETVLLGAYPGGAMCVGYLLPKGVQADQMRKLAFSVLNQRYPGVNAAAAIRVA